jgi:hydrogenase nickel incorporation protein HypA/HybF
MQEAMRIVFDHASRARSNRVLTVKLRVGALSGVEPDALEFAFHVVSRDTPAEWACLTIEKVPVTCLCRDCDREFEPTSPFYDCPGCGALSTDIHRGREFQVVAIEVE